MNAKTQPEITATSIPTPQPLVDIHDRVTEAYYGKMGPQFMRETQQRIHWICSQVQGSKVLDVGCSQGVTAILLGREGKQVTAVDAAQRSIEQAQQYLAAETSRVQANVSFITGDFLAANFSNTPFETIIIAEVLEHLLQPENFIDAAAKQLDDNGRLIVTVPFGINDFIDHKHTYYLLEPYRLMSRHFEVIDIVVLGKWLGLAGRRRTEKEKIPSTETLKGDLVRQLETAFLTLERSLREDAASVHARLNDANLKYRTACEQITTLKQRVAQEELARKQGEVTSSQLQQQIKNTEQELAQAQSRLSETSNHSKQEQTAYREAMAQLETEHRALLIQLSKEQENHKHANTLIKQEREELSLVQSARNAAEHTIAQLNSQLAIAEHLSSHLSSQLTEAKLQIETEQKEKQTAIERLEVTLNAQRESRHEAEKRLIRLEVEQETITTALKAANERYQLANAQVEQVSEKLSLSQAAKQASEQSVLELNSQLGKAEQYIEVEQQARKYDIEHLTNTLATQNESLLRAEEKLALLEAEYAAVSALLNEETNKHQIATEQIISLTQQVQDNKAAQLTQQKSSKLLQQKLDTTKAHLEKESEAAWQLAILSDSENANLQKKIAAVSESISKYENKIGALENDLATAKSTDEKNQVTVSTLSAELEHAQQKRSGHYIHLEAERKKNELLEQKIKKMENTNLLFSKTKIEEQSKHIEKLKIELEFAQAKRSGHYAHLEAERKKNIILAKKVELLEKDNKRMSSSLSLAVGSAIVSTKNIKDALLLPRKLRDAIYKHKEKLRLNQNKKNIIAQKIIYPTNQSTIKTNNPDTNEIHQQETHQATSNIQLPAPKTTEIKTKLQENPVQKVNNKTPKPNDLMIHGWPLPEQNSKIRVMSVFDEFSRECFAPQANLIEPRPDNWLQLLDRDNPEFLLIESTWRGNKSTWQYRVAKYANPPGQELSAMVAEFQSRKIPTIFWNKEDPVHFDNFIHAAQEFDYIFTTAEEAISLYAQRSKATITVLPFAAEAGLHNPIGSGLRNDKVCFAGSFYANRFIERRDDQLMLLDAASHFDLDIFDRNAGANVAKDFCFPERFDQFIKGKLPYNEMSKAYRNYRVFLNVNSVIDSKTMFSRRVFELLACGTPIVSTVSAGIEEMFGSDLVWMVKNEAEAKAAIDTLLSSPTEWRRRSLQGIRAVFSQHTFAHRFQEILQIAGIREHFIDEKRVLLIAEVNTQAELDSIIDNYARQKLNNTKTCMLAIARQNGLFAKEKNIELIESKELFSELVLKKSKQWNASHIAFIDPCALYGAYYLQDILHAFDYSNADLIGKPRSNIDSYAYGIDIEHSGSVLKTTIFEQGNFSVKALDRDGLALEIQRINKQVFMSDAANFFNSTAILTGQQRSLMLQQIEI